MKKRELNLNSPFFLLSVEQQIQEGVLDPQLAFCLTHYILSGEKLNPDQEANSLLTQELPDKDKLTTRAQTLISEGREIAIREIENFKAPLLTEAFLHSLNRLSETRVNSAFTVIYSALTLNRYIASIMSARVNAEKNRRLSR